LVIQAVFKITLKMYCKILQTLTIKEKTILLQIDYKIKNYKKTKHYQKIGPVVLMDNITNLQHLFKMNAVVHLHIVNNYLKRMMYKALYNLNIL
jgi:hypothetical protein